MHPEPRYSNIAPRRQSKAYGLRPGDRVIVLSDGRPYRDSYSGQPYAFIGFPDLTLSRPVKFGDLKPNSVVRLVRTKRQPVERAS